MTAKNILLVEDEYGTAEVLQLMLEIEGWRVVIASNGRDALAQIAAGMVPDCVLADFMMPIMNGAQLGLALRAQLATAAVPIIMTSAADESEVRRQFDGYDAFVHKPYRLDDLLPLLRRMLSAEHKAARAPADPRATGHQRPDADDVVRLALRRLRQAWPAPPTPAIPGRLGAG